ncbi:hypothetical protein BDV28DRAFT_146844 [Aspergillus coremiiformis]|uniref:Uncharacterized protein n=1 Tax=Aspergillus coremiiformis TaxID=138285 RepID=A0A5N6ZAQ6_9EURO|nr:hypothetical protein BDV28DRAFT_146844 [Aspergillus coremiiformis]
MPILPPEQSPVPYAAVGPLRPCVIPQIRKTWLGRYMSPFARAYAPELAQVGISQPEFIAFIDSLNEAFLIHPGFHAVQAVGAVVGMIPSITVQLANTGVTLAAAAGAVGVSRLRTKQLLKCANITYFHQKGLHVRIMNREEMLSAIGCSAPTHDTQGVTSDTTEIETESHETMSEHDIFLQKMEPLNGMVMPLLYDVSQPTEQNDWVKKIGVAHACWTEKRQLARLRKDHDKKIEKKGQQQKLDEKRDTEIASIQEEIDHFKADLYICESNNDRRQLKKDLQKTEKKLERRTKEKSGGASESGRDSDTHPRKQNEVLWLVITSL